MKNKKLHMRFIIFLVLILFFCVFQYIKINKYFPKKYQIDKYSVGQKIHLDSLDIQVKDFKKVQHSLQSQGDQNTSCIVVLNIKNISNIPVNIQSIIEDSKLSLGVYYQDYCNVIGDLKNIKNLPSDQEINLSLEYVIFGDVLKHSNNKDDFAFYPSKSLYKNQINNKLKELKFYGKCVELKSS